MKLSRSENINQSLAKFNIFNYEDVLNHIPRSYEDMSPSDENNIIHKERIVLYGKLASIPTLSYFSSLSLVRFRFLSTSNRLYNIAAYNRPYLMKSLNIDTPYVLVGIYDKEKNKINLIRLSRYDEISSLKPRPIYSLPTNVDQYLYSRLVEKAFKYFSENKIKIQNDIPSFFMKKYRLIDKMKALNYLHHPNNFNEIRMGLRTLKYEECLKFALKSELIREENKKLSKNNKQHILLKEVDKFINTLPYKLTNSQKDAITEILFDMNKTSLMYRLLQGDVGSGKTLVAMIALYGNYLRGDQGAFMAPTDALARQHFLTLKKLFINTPIRIALLIGQMPIKAKREIELGLINHQIDIVVGTHALFSESVNYLSLGLAIIDEQHRFGVNQRLLLASKGNHTDLLLMSATPIPRTLALTIYGDLDVSTLKEFPFDNKNVTTKIVTSEDDLITYLIDESLKNNKQIYIIAPLILDDFNKRVTTETLFAKYLLKYPGKVALLHGKLNEEEKILALSNFINNKTPIIVSTTVIEVGLDVKSANLMIIYEANSFGLASLHQLRGRIGRDGNKANCLLVYDGDDEEEKNKLKVLTASNDGFYIANEDLKRRGPGELGGYRQSGLPSFNFVNIINDFKIFECAREDSKYIMKHKIIDDFRPIIKISKHEIDKAKFTNV